MDKSKQIWYRFKSDQKQLKLDCVDILGKCYVMIGQKPDSQQIVMMAQLLYDDLINRYSRMEIDEVKFALEEGIRNAGTSCFINVNSWNEWLKTHRKSEELKRQQRLITDYQKHEQSQKRISLTINKAKKLK
tara:strand:+ start:1254 stop:1649 length:396 start_codon:yes stop_codon:yes gene_type:complete